MVGGGVRLEDVVVGFFEGIGLWVCWIEFVVGNWGSEGIWLVVGFEDGDEILLDGWGGGGIDKDGGGIDEVDVEFLLLSEKVGIDIDGVDGLVLGVVFFIGLMSVGVCLIVVRGGGGIRVGLLFCKVGFLDILLFGVFCFVCVNDCLFLVVLLSCIFGWVVEEFWLDVMVGYWFWCYWMN